jgi:phenylalanyl-tRNA synthetase beta chain
MKVPWSWLTEYVEMNESSQEVMRRLTAVGHMQDGPAKKIAGDEVYDLEVRQNRSDCLSMIGVAREVAAVLDKPLKNPLAKLAPVTAGQGTRQLEVANKELCYRFNSIRLAVTIGPSPEWLRQRLEAYGMKSINNVIDITNYVMIEAGQPLHAFDTAKLSTQNLTIRIAQAGEKLTVLGGREIELSSEDLVIADGEVVALAGVIGGESSGVSKSTQEIILEAATYNQASVRRTALRHNLRTEASTRLEKFLHPEGTELALARAVELLTSLADARVLDAVDAYAQPLAQKTLELRPQAVARLGGIELDLSSMQALLAREEISSSVDSKALRVTIPYWRTDLEQEADLVEEVLRLYGYDKIPEKMPAGVVPKDVQSKYYDLEEKLRDLFTACGFDEQITEPLVNESNPRQTPVTLQNSLSSEKVMLRTTLNNQLLSGAYNRRRYRQTDIRLFEVGKVYELQNDQPREQKVVGAILAGSHASYAKMKGVAEVVLTRMGAVFHPDLAHIEALDAQTFVLTIDTEALLNWPRQTLTKILTTPPQMILEDWSLLVPEETRVGELLALVSAHSPLVRKVELGEEPRALQDGQKSIFVKIAFHDPTRTLKAEDIVSTRQSILEELRYKFNAKLR